MQGAHCDPATGRGLANKVAVHIQVLCIIVMTSKVKHYALVSCMKRSAAAAIVELTEFKEYHLADVLGQDICISQFAHSHV